MVVRAAFAGRFVRSGLAFAVASAFCVGVQATPDVDALVPAHIVSDRCDVKREWSFWYLSNLLGLDSERLVRLQLIRGLNAVDICTMPEQRLRRAMQKTAEPKPDSPGEAASFREAQRRGSDGRVDPDGLLRAMAARDAMVAAQVKGAQGSVEPTDAGVSRASWTSLGPGNIGGRIRALATVPGQPSVLYAGSVGGGIWRTSNAGASWSPLDGFAATLSVSSIIVDPTNTNVLYAGTGEGFYNIDAIRGAGIFKSIDGGLSWYALPSTSPSVNENWRYVNRLTIKPDDPRVLLAATGGGIYRSTDSGVTWAQLSTTRTLDIRFHPTQSLRVLAGLDDGYVMTSSDGGASFARVRVPPTASDGSRSWSRVEIAWSGASATAYASVSTAPDPTSTIEGRVYKSTDGGITWLLRSSPFHLSGQGWYNNAIWVDPSNDNHVIIGGLDNHRSTDGALTFSKVSRWWCAPVQSHADNHVIVSAADYNGGSVRTIFWGNDGGVYRVSDTNALLAQSDNASCTADGWASLNNNLSITQFYGVGAHPAGSAVYGGTQDNGSLVWAGSGTSWRTVAGGDGGASVVDPTDPNFLYGEYVYAAIHRSTNGTSANAFASFICAGIEDANKGSCSPTATSEANFISPIALDPANPSVMYVGAKRLWRSTNVKATTPGWSVFRTQAPDRTPPNAPAYWAYVSAIAISPTNSAVVYVGHNDGRVFRTTNATSATPTWAELACPSVSYPVWYRQVLRLTVDPANPNIVYAGHGGYNNNNLWRLDASGASVVCSNIGSALPPSPIRAIARHPTMATWLYVGTEVGLFASEDLGATWKAATDGPVNVSVEELVWQNGTTLIAATHGRGVFKANITTSAACSYAVTPNQLAISKAGGSVTFDVSANFANCPWSATSYTAHITTTSSGSGTGQATFSVAPYAGSTTISYFVTVAGRSVLITQYGSDSNCSLDVDSDGQFLVATDAMLIMRYALGLRGAQLTSGIPFQSDATTDPATLAAIIGSRKFDFNGNGRFDLSDALIAERALRGVTGPPVANGLTIPGGPAADAIATTVALCKR